MISYLRQFKHWAAVNKMLPMLGCLFVFVIAPLFHSSYFEDPFILPKTLALAFGAFLLAMEMLRRGIIQETLMDGAIKFFWIALIICTIMSVDIPVSILGQYRQQFHGLLQMAIYTVIFYGMASAEYLSLDIILGGLLITGGIVFQTACWQLDSILDGRAWGTFAGPVLLGSFIALIAPLAWSWARSGEAHPAKEILGYLILTVCAVAILAAKARGAMLAAAIGIAAFEILSGQIALVALVSAVMIVVLIFWHPFRAGSDLGRLEIWKAAFYGFVNRPIVGHGPDTFVMIFRKFIADKEVAFEGGSRWIQMSAHNDVLQILSTMGIIGILAYMLFVFNLFLGLYLCSDRSNNAKGILAAVVAVFFVAKFNPIDVSVIAICAGLVGATVRLDAMRTRWRTVAFAFISTLALFVVWKQCRADALVKIADTLNENKHPVEAADYLHLAALENPLEMYYMEREIMQLWAISPLIHKGDMRDVSAASMYIANRAVWLHPNNADSHDLRSLSLKTLAIGFKQDTLKESMAEMDTAMTLAPTFKNYVRDGMFIAKELGNKQRARELKARYDYIDHLEKNGRPD